MYKQLFFIVSNVIICFPIIGMNQEQQEKGLIIMPRDIINTIWI